MARLYNWLTDPQRNPKIIGSRLNDEFDNIFSSSFALARNACRIYLNANQTGVASATITRVNFDTIDFDPDGIADVVTNHRIQPKVAGKYVVTGSVNMSGTSPTDSGISIEKNGVQAANQFLNAAPSLALAVIATTSLFDMNGTTDYIELFGYQQVTAGTVTYVAGTKQSFLNCVRVA